MENSKIEWTDHTWSPWWGCTAVSNGEKGACTNCYADGLGKRFGVEWGAGKPRRLAGPGYWDKPRIWNAKAARAGTRPFVFPSMCDPFDREVDPLWRVWFFERIRSTPSLVWLLLTKRPSMIEKLSAEAGGLPRNAAIGASIVTQEEWDRDALALEDAAVALRPLFTFTSMEPLMGPVVMRYFLPDWVIAGGESGPKARPSHPDWFRSLRDQCAAAGVPFLYKQWGEWGPIRSRDLDPEEIPTVLAGAEPRRPWVESMEKLGKKHTGRSLDGREHNEFPPGFGKQERAVA